MDMDKIPHTRMTHDTEYLYNNIKSGKIVTQPEFQRRYWWDSKLQTGLINTILQGRVVPELFTYVYREQGFEEVIDGQQRLETVRRFIDNEFGLDKSSCEIPELSGLTFSHLDSRMQNVMLSYPLNICKIYADDVDDEIKIQMFVDLNPIRSRGIKHQEVRNCIFRGKYNNFIKKLASEKAFRIAFNTDEDHSRMLDVETVLAFFCALDGELRWHGQQRAISKYMKKMAVFFEKTDENQLLEVKAKLRDKFKHGLQCALDIFGNRAFCSRVAGKTGSFSRKYFITIMIVLQDFKHEVLLSRKSKIVDAVERWIRSNPDLWTGHASRTVSSYQQRFEALRDVINVCVA